MGKIRVEELARMMGVQNQDLVFKLRSIGIRVEGDEAHIDSDAISAILQGKKLPQPREVILRDEPAPEVRRPGPPARRPTVNPLRPVRPRNVIQRVDPPIRTIPSTERPVEAAILEAAEAAQAAEAAEQESAMAAAEAVETTSDPEPAAALAPTHEAPLAAPVEATLQPSSRPGPTAPTPPVRPPSTPGPWPGMPVPGSIPPVRTAYSPPSSRMGAPGSPRPSGPGQRSPSSGPGTRPPSGPSRPSGYSSGTPSRPSGYSPSAPRPPGSGYSSGAPRPAGPGYSSSRPGTPRPAGSRPGSPAPSSRPGETRPADSRGGETRPGAGARAAGPRPADAQRDKDRDKKKKGVKKPTGIAAETEAGDLRSYRGSIQEIEAAEAEQEGGASRRGRRAERKEAEGDENAKVLTFRIAAPSGPITIAEGMTVRDFSEKLGVKSRDLIKVLFDRGILANINHVLEPELARKLAEDMGVEAMVVTYEEEVQLKQELGPRTPSEGKAGRAPVVTIMGHVDHGKTSLLDAIRSSKVTESEFGGITQHIGAYQVEVRGKKIVFIDTPGHEAFTMMRARGARVTDIVVLVVAADDGVMPQTVEAIDHAKAARVPIVVAINKVDKANANQDRVKKELSDRGLMVEEWGGQTVAVPISALKKQGINELLEMILLTADLLDLKASPELPAQGVVLEARKEIGRGVVGTVLVQNGTLKVGDVFVAGATWGRVRAMSDDLGARSDEAPPATPVEVTGFSEVPAAGDPFQVVEQESKAREIVSFRRQELRHKDLAPTQGTLSLEQLFSQIQQGEMKDLPVVLKADVQGSVEVLRDTLAKLSTEKVKVTVIHTAVGAISTNDVLLASASKAIVVGFNVRPERNAAELAEKEGVDIRLHTVIYELSDELRKAMVGLLDPTYREVSRGRAEVRDVFKVPKVGTIAGCHVLEGVVPRAATVRLVRDGRVVYEGKISSLRRFKDDASEVRAGFDCGIGLDRFQDMKPGDIIEVFGREQVAATL